VTIGIWLGEHNRNRDVPALAYQFHTAMLDADQVEPYSTVVLYHTPLEELQLCSAQV